MDCQESKKRANRIASLIHRRFEIQKNSFTRQKQFHVVAKAESTVDTQHRTSAVLASMSGVVGKGKVMGAYVLGDVIGSGTFGSVYRARSIV